jgi:glycosyltransferase involved in cell wall biosynthesis
LSYDAVFTDNERVGAFAGMLLRLRRKRPVHVMLGHHLTPWKKRPFLTLARGGIDRLIVHSEMQRRLAVEKLGFSAGAVAVLPYQVDTQFWQPMGTPPSDLICTAGLECRDYPTLIQAVRNLPVEVKIGAASHWSGKRSGIESRSLPENVEVRPYAYPDLRRLYDRSRLVVVPLLDVDFQAGITLILEAMAIAKPVVISASRGLPDVVRGPLWAPGQSSWPHQGPQPDASSGIYVPPGDAAALRSAIAYLLASPDVAAELGRNGRQRAESDYGLAQFTSRFAEAIRRAAQDRAVEGVQAVSGDAVR